MSLDHESGSRSGGVANHSSAISVYDRNGCLPLDDFDLRRRRSETNNQGGRMAYAASTVVGVLVTVAFYGVAVLGMIGLTRAAHRLAIRRGWRESRLIAFTIATGFGAFVGGWLIFLAWWPIARLLRPWPRLRIIGPTVGGVALVISGAAVLNVLDPTTQPFFLNDTGQSAIVSGCTQDPATFHPGEEATNVGVSAKARSCYIDVGDSGNQTGCLMLPAHLSEGTLIRLSAYTRTTHDCP